jgi:hypothetical protein
LLAGCSLAGSEAPRFSGLAIAARPLKFQIYIYLFIFDFLDLSVHVHIYLFTPLTGFSLKLWLCNVVGIFGH